MAGEEDGGGGEGGVGWEEPDRQGAQRAVARPSRPGREYSSGRACSAEIYPHFRSLG